MVWNANILPLKEAIKIVRQLNLKGKGDYEKWWIKKKPINLPRMAYKVYVLSKKHGEWPKEKKSAFWTHYLGTNVISNQEKNKQWITYEEASTACQKAGIKTQKQFFESGKNGTLPKGVPTRPYIIYKNSGWPKPTKESSSWGIFLGTNSMKRGQITYWSFNKARRYVRKIAKQYGLKNEKPDWRNFCKTGKLRKEIPRNPALKYGKEYSQMELEAASFDDLEEATNSGH